MYVIVSPLISVISFNCPPILMYDPTGKSCEPAFLMFTVAKEDAAAAPNFCNESAAASAAAVRSPHVCGCREFCDVVGGCMSVFLCCFTH